MDFSSAFSGFKGGSIQEKKETLKNQISANIARENVSGLMYTKEVFRRFKLIVLWVAQAETLLTKATEKCYAKCVTSPSTSLSSKEEKCLGSCLERYFEAFNLISSTYIRRISEQRGALPGE